MAVTIGDVEYHSRGYAGKAWTATGGSGHWNGSSASDY
jgi:hypothetical protein